MSEKRPLYYVNSPEEVNKSTQRLAELSLIVGKKWTEHPSVEDLESFPIPWEEIILRRRQIDYYDERKCSKREHPSSFMSLLKNMGLLGQCVLKTIGFIKKILSSFSSKNEDEEFLKRKEKRKKEKKALALIQKTLNKEDK